MWLWLLLSASRDATAATGSSSSSNSRDDSSVFTSPKEASGDFDTKDGRGGKPETEEEVRASVDPTDDVACTVTTTNAKPKAQAKTKRKGTTHVPLVLQWSKQDLLGLFMLFYVEPELSTVMALLHSIALYFLFTTIGTTTTAEKSSNISMANGHHQTCQLSVRAGQ
jgi:hypothetical protein